MTLVRVGPPAFQVKLAVILCEALGRVVMKLYAAQRLALRVESVDIDPPA